MSERANWIWMPHPGHFICGRDCRFFLNTYVGKYIVSTIGEWLPDSQAREIIAKTRNVVLSGIGDEREADFLNKVGFEEVGSGRKYETMVFVAKESKNKCRPYTAKNGNNVDFAGYNTAGEAYKGHLKMCNKWSKKATTNKENKNLG
jgi:hypothetical protein